MSNTFGTLFRVTTCGESHGAGLLAIVDGVPPNLALCEADIQAELDRRKPAQSKFTTQRKEDDSVHIISGVFEGRTTGTPIGLVIHNNDQKSKDYANIKDVFRPNHADYTYLMKYGIRDYRGGGRASARETAMRVATGAIAKKLLKERLGVVIKGCVTQIGNEIAHSLDWETVNHNPFFCGDAQAVARFEKLIATLRKQGTSCGARLEVYADNVPVGLGSPVFGKLDAHIAYAMMGINAVKAVEIGDGCAVAGQFGHLVQDEMTPTGFLSNHAGGILGGIATGQTIKVALSFKPTPSITTPAQSIDINGKPCMVATKGRHDPCVGIRAVPIAEAMLALVLADQYLLHRAQNADVVAPLGDISKV